MPAKKLKEFLDGEKIQYRVIRHEEAFTAQGIAASAHIPGRELAKTVMVKLDGRMAMAVLPASYKVNFKLLKEASGAKRVELASEQEFKDMFPECAIGAMPPFGNLYGIDVYVAQSLTGNEMIAFNAGSHIELIRMSYNDFERLVQPKTMKFSVQAA
jgi:Ala-tRNA(Pro) deacylase